MHSIYDQNYVAIDLETTSVDKETTKIVELGSQMFTIESKVILDGPYYSQLVNPEISIPPEASSAHQLRDEDVVGCPTIDQVLARYMEDINYKVIVIHNADFDYPILKRILSEHGQGICPVVVIDTLAFARKLLADKLSSFTLGTLFHHYKVPRKAGEDFHRAGYDCEILAIIFGRLLSDYGNKFGVHSLSRLEEILDYIYCVEPFEKMPFGKYKDKVMSDIPIDYLQWWLFKRNPSDSEEEKPLVDYTFAKELSSRRLLDRARCDEIIARAEAKLKEKSYPIELATAETIEF